MRRVTDSTILDAIAAFTGETGHAPSFDRAIDAVCVKGARRPLVTDAILSLVADGLLVLRTIPDLRGVTVRLADGLPSAADEALLGKHYTPLMQQYYASSRSYGSHSPSQLLAVAQEMLCDHARTLRRASA